MLETLVGKEGESFVVNGFAVTVPSGTTLRITRDQNGAGSVLAAYRTAEGVKYGLYITGGEASRDVDLASFGDGSYGVYIRGVLRETQYESRAFWEQNTANEVVRGMAVRFFEDWEYIVATQSPGDDWTATATITKTGGSLVVSADLRRFFFEGQESADFDPSADWGTTNDRNNDRATYGIKNFRTLARAVLAKIQDIYGGTPTNFWWKSVADRGIQNLTELFNNKLARNGSQTMLGDLLPSPTDTHTLGSAAARWIRAVAQQFDADTFAAGETMLSNETDRATVRYRTWRPSPGGHRVKELSRVRIGGATGTDTSEVWTCSGSVVIGTPGVNYLDATIEVYNATYSETLVRWDRWASGAAYMIIRNRHGWGLYVFDATVTTNWTDAGWVMLQYTRGAGTTLTGAFTNTGGATIQGVTYPQGGLAPPSLSASLTAVTKDYLYVNQAPRALLYLSLDRSAQTITVYTALGCTAAVVTTAGLSIMGAATVDDIVRITLDQPIIRPQVQLSWTNFGGTVVDNTYAAYPDTSIFGSNDIDLVEFNGINPVNIGAVNPGTDTLISVAIYGNYAP